MGQHTAIISEHQRGPTARRAGVLLLCAAASGVLAIGALGQAPQANATCLSVSGINLIGHTCTSTFGNIATGIGPGAGAVADGGVFGSAFALGTGANATESGSLNRAVAVGNSASVQIASGNLDHLVAVGNQAESCSDFGVGNLGIAVGNPGPNPGPDPSTGYTQTYAYAEGTFNRAVAVGKGAIAWSVPSNTHTINNTALALGPGNYAVTWGNQRNNHTLAVGSQNIATVNALGGQKSNTVAVAFGKHKTTQK
jgi:hypothetical protein